MHSYAPGNLEISREIFFGIFGRFFAEKSVFGEPGKEKCKEISTAEKIA